MAEEAKMLRRKPVEVIQGNVKNFMEQFDTIICDCDGVLWFLGIFPGVKEALECLRKAGKKILFATNNSVIPPCRKFERFGIPVIEEEVAHPAPAIAWHLKKIGFKQKAFVIGSEHFRHVLQSAGFAIVPEEKTGEPIEEDVISLINSIQRDPEIGAVIIDVDLNLKSLELSQALNYLQRPDCLFLAGATDSTLPFPDGTVFVGPGHFIRVLEDASGRKANIIGKPSPMMVSEYLKEIHNLDLTRAVFVGDQLETDMGVANACGMKKLLVLTGISTLDDVDTCDPAMIPDYYIKSLADFTAMLENSP